MKGNILKEFCEDVDLIKLYKEGKPKYLLICSYTLGLGYLEHKLFYDLRRKYDTKITVVTSQLGIKESFQESYSLASVGTEYKLFQINDYPYAFHPKIYLFIDQDDLLHLYLGGSNFTYPGMCLNLDVIDSMNYKDMNKESITQLVDFLKALSNQIVDPEFEESLIKFREKLLLEPQDLNECIFLSNFNSSLISEMAKIVKGNVKLLRVISPYFDRNLYALKELKKIFVPTKMEILFNDKDPHINLKEFPQQSKLYTSGSDRFLHAKIYIFYTDSSSYIFSGSANCTGPGIINTIANGNWETLLCRLDVAKDYADKLWASYEPEALKKSDHWKYKKPEVKGVLSSGYLLFNATLNYETLSITPIKNFPLKAFKSRLILKLKNSFEFVIDISKDILNKTIVHHLNPEIKELIGENPFRVEIIIQSPQNHTGECWVMQKHLLRKSGAIRKLENAISKLRSDDKVGLDQILEIIGFISEHLDFIALKKPPSSKSQITKNIQGDSVEKIPTIKGVYTVDQLLPSSSWNTSVSDLLDIGVTIKKLITSGLPLDLDYGEEAGDEDENDVGYSKTPNKNSKNNIKEKYDDELNTEYERNRIEILKNLPNLKSIFQESIIEPYDDFYGTIKINEINLENVRFEPLLQTIVFCLKLIRFIRLELSSRLKNSDHSNSVDTYFYECTFLLKWFFRKYFILTQKLEKDKNKIADLFISSELIPEVILLLSEVWNYNLENRIGFKTILDIIEEFKYLYNSETIINSVQILVTGSEIFHPERKSLLVDKNKIPRIIEDILLYSERNHELGEKLRKIIKYHYWKDAHLYHSKAIEYMKAQNNQNIELFQRHLERQIKSEKLMFHIRSRAQEILGGMFDKKLFDQNEFYTISEIDLYLEIPKCINCNKLLTDDLILDLKQFKIVKCSHCNIIYIPVNKFEAYPGLRESDDDEWEMNLEDIL